MDLPDQSWPAALHQSPSTSPAKYPSTSNPTSSRKETHHKPSHLHRTPDTPSDSFSSAISRSTGFSASFDGLGRLARRPAVPTRRFDKRPDRPSRPSQITTNQPVRITRLPPIPNHDSLLLGEPDHNNNLLDETTLSPTGVAFTPRDHSTYGRVTSGPKLQPNCNPTACNRPIRNDTTATRDANNPL